VPPPVLALAGDDPVTLVWVNELDGLTFALGTGRRRRFVKWAPAGSGLDLAAEAARLRWAVRYTPVPHLLGEGADPAVATWSATWNYGPGWENLLLDAYGIAPTQPAPATAASSET
jgi:aminoglycoside phosphotransferase